MSRVRDRLVDLWLYPIAIVLLLFFYFVIDRHDPNDSGMGPIITGDD